MQLLGLTVYKSPCLQVASLPANGVPAYGRSSTRRNPQEEGK
jgi:hypothetical protein